MNFNNSQLIIEFDQENIVSNIEPELNPFSQLTQNSIVLILANAWY